MVLKTPKTFSQLCDILIFPCRHHKKASSSFSKSLGNSQDQRQFALKKTSLVLTLIAQELITLSKQTASCVFFCGRKRLAHQGCQKEMTDERVLRLHAPAFN
jgi:hypothetical protein